MLLTTFSKRKLLSMLILQKKIQFHYSIVPAVGYAMATGWTGVIASNIAFYLDDNPAKVSSITTSVYYSQFNQYWLLLNSNIFDEPSQLNFVGDWRIYHFPTNTYGLGTNNNLSDAVPIDFSYLKFYEDVLKEIYPESVYRIGLSSRLSLAH